MSSRQGLDRKKRDKEEKHNGNAERPLFLSTHTLFFLRILRIANDADLDRCVASKLKLETNPEQRVP